MRVVHYYIHVQYRTCNLFCSQHRVHNLLFTHNTMRKPDVFTRNATPRAYCCNVLLSGPLLFRGDQPIGGTPRGVSDTRVSLPMRRQHAKPVRASPTLCNLSDKDAYSLPHLLGNRVRQQEWQLLVRCTRPVPYFLADLATQHQRQ
jgi:hypothetical protein